VSLLDRLLWRRRPRPEPVATPPAPPPARLDWDDLGGWFAREDLDEVMAARAVLDRVEGLTSVRQAHFLCSRGAAWPRRDRFLEPHPLPEAHESGLVHLAERSCPAGFLLLDAGETGPAHPELPSRLRSQEMVRLALQALPAWAPWPGWLLAGLGEDAADRPQPGGLETDLANLAEALAALLWVAEGRRQVRDLLAARHQMDDRLVVQGFEMERMKAQAEREVEGARGRVEEAERAKNEFLSSVSHELRTPLNAIQGYTRMVLREATLTDRQRLSLERVMNSSQNQLRLINNILDYSRLEAGRMRLELEELDLDPVLRDVVAQVEPLVADQGLELRYEREASGADLRTFSDRAKLEQVLINLAGNAIKFTSRGRITLRVAARPGTLLVSVEDTGIGVAPEEQEAIFERFRRSSRTEGARTASGTGLGLAISRRLAELLGGRLTLESSLGVGSSFTLALPRFVDLETARLALGAEETP